MPPAHARRAFSSAGQVPAVVPAPLGPSLSKRRGVRMEGKDRQMGLAPREIASVHHLLPWLLERVDAGEIGTLQARNRVLTVSTDSTIGLLLPWNRTS